MTTKSSISPSEEILCGECTIISQSRENLGLRLLKPREMSQVLEKSPLPRRVEEQQDRVTREHLREKVVVPLMVPSYKISPKECPRK